MTPREHTEQRERDTLSLYASLSAESRGRLREDAKCPLRSEFQRDRDRILHCKAFRRLSHKTQVFIAPVTDHYRTRLTHTLEVSQIARTISRALRANEDLTEAIVLGHDLGHPPFGHAGEEALNQAYREFVPNAKFLHYEHSLRIVDFIEKDGEGLNLTHEVRAGILGHSKGRANLLSRSRNDLLDEDFPSSLEGQVVRVADRIAYVNHDIDDAIRAGLLVEEDLPKDIRQTLGARHSVRITRMVQDLVEHSQDSAEIRMSPEVLEATDCLKDFLFANVYSGSSAAKVEEHKILGILSGLFRHYMDHPELVPRIGEGVDGDAASLARTVCDYIAGMTDRFAKQQYALFFLPKEWGST
ncbi:MAG: deoxyguanosinetriphosphate triphosphohydrolase [Armatimonadetes bacterium]|nr:deoxyguanosinetriphosphate triphosphohydrolase [Armatimonadota bacterium]